MEFWKKIKDFIAFVGLGLLAIFGIAWAIRRIEGSQKDHIGIDGNKREIRNGIADQGKSTVANIARVDRIETILGDGEKRQSETTGIVEESRNARQRARDFVDKLPK